MTIAGARWCFDKCSQNGALVLHASSLDPRILLHTGHTGACGQSDVNSMDVLTIMTRRTAAIEIDRTRDAGECSVSGPQPLRFRDRDDVSEGWESGRGGWKTWRKPHLAATFIVWSSSNFEANFFFAFFLSPFSGRRLCRLGRLAWVALARACCGCLGRLAPPLPRHEGGANGATRGVPRCARDAACGQ